MKSIILFPLTVIYKIYILICFVLLLVLLYPFLHFFLSKKDRFPSAFKLMKFYAKLFLICAGIILKINGRENIVEDQPYLICSVILLVRLRIAVTGMPVKVDDTSTAEYKRFSKAESVSFDGSSAAVPIVYDNQNYGVICFEVLKKNAYSNADIQFLKVYQTYSRLLFILSQLNLCLKAILQLT